MTATAVTHPLDTVRLRLALPHHPYRGLAHAISTIVRKEGPAALYVLCAFPLSLSLSLPPSFSVKDVS